MLFAALKKIAKKTNTLFNWISWYYVIFRVGKQQVLKNCGQTEWESLNCIAEWQFRMLITLWAIGDLRTNEKWQKKKKNRMGGRCWWRALLDAIDHKLFGGHGANLSAYRKHQNNQRWLSCIWMSTIHARSSAEMAYVSVEYTISYRLNEKTNELLSQMLSNAGRQ